MKIALTLFYSISSTGGGAGYNCCRSGLIKKFAIKLI